MKEATPQLKCTCAHCEHIIYYPADQAGRKIECPNCKQESLLPPAPGSAMGRPKSQAPPINAKWVISAVFSVVVVGAVALFLVRQARQAAPEADTQATTATFPKSKGKHDRSLNDLKIGSFTLQPLPGTDSRMIVGEIENVSETFHRGIKVELELRDAQGLKIGTLESFINELTAHKTWRVLERTSDPRVASVRVAGIKEEP